MTCPNKSISVLSTPAAVGIWLGILSLAVIVLIVRGCESSSAVPVGPVVPADAIAIPMIESGQTATEAVHIFERLHFQKNHKDLQNSYLSLVEKISNSGQPTVDVREQRLLYNNYKAAQARYRDTIRQVDDYQKDQKLKCFSMMKSLIRGIMYYDQKVGKRLTRFEPELLLKEGVFTTVPRCPENGTYTIIVRNERRFFHCSVHGILRN